MVTDTDVVVVGAGIVGAATARAITERFPGIDVLVVDKATAPAQHQTGRNSGVLHSGCYYEPDSAKAALVREGRAALRSFCSDHGIPIVDSGKVVVATRVSELVPLAQIERRARAGGIATRRLGGRDLATIEPYARGVAALSVPSTSAVDFRAVTRALLDDVAAAGGEFRGDTEVRSVVAGPSGLGVATTAGTIRARWLVNCAGLQSDRVAQRCGAQLDVRIVPFRGDYFELTADGLDLCRTMIYPVPDPRWPFLGVHLTRGVDGSVHAGPTAVLALGREAYTGGVDRTDARALLADRALRRLAARYWTTGAAELLRSRSVRLVARALQRMVPDLRTEHLRPSSSGIRAQALRDDGTLVDDFEFASSPRAVHVVNAPSPAATASLAIGRVVTDRLAAVMADT
ncbi:MAG: L-2-hydroxyglutarate oxidase [Actinomycetes bacterium]